MGRPIHFEIHAEDPAACAAFYQAWLGWRALEIPGMEYWSLATGAGEGIDGAIIRRRGPAPQPRAPVNAYVVTIASMDLDADLACAVAAGAEITVAPFLLPGLGRSAYLRDPCGNLVGIFQEEARHGGSE